MSLEINVFPGLVVGTELDAKNIEVDKVKPEARVPLENPLATVSVNEVPPTAYKVVEMDAIWVDVKPSTWFTVIPEVALGLRAEIWDVDKIEMYSVLK